MSTRRSPARYCIVGAGPGGLAMANAFRRAGIDFDIYERLPTLGGIWDISNPQSPLYERIRLVSPARLSGFPGFPMPATFPAYPSHHHVLRYLHDFAETLHLDGALRLSTDVHAVRPADGNRWEVCTRHGVGHRYDGIVFACGHTWAPHLPTHAGDFTGPGIHSCRYRRPEPYAGMSVLVVGGGNSGCDIACDLVGTAARVTLSLRRGYFFLPRYVRGQPTAEWARSPGFSERILGALLGRQVRLLDPFGVPRPDHHLFETNPVISDEIIDSIVAGDVIARRDIAGFDGRSAIFTDGVRETFDAVIFATGYDYSLPILDPLITWTSGRTPLLGNMFLPAHDRLFVLGLVEHDGSAFPVLSAQAQVVAQIAVLAAGADDAQVGKLIMDATASKDFSGGRRYVDSHRHTISVNRAVYLDYLARLEQRLQDLGRAGRGDGSR